MAADAHELHAVVADIKKARRRLGVFCFLAGALVLPGPTYMMLSIGAQAFEPLALGCYLLIALLMLGPGAVLSFTEGLSPEWRLVLDAPERVLSILKLERNHKGARHVDTDFLIELTEDATVSLRVPAWLEG